MAVGWLTLKHRWQLKIHSMNIGDKAYFVGQGNQQPVGVIIQAIGGSGKYLCKPIDCDMVNDYWIPKKELNTSIDEVRDSCVRAYKMRLKGRLSRLASA